MSLILNEHQNLPIKFIRNNFGLILYHSTGSGKTITALAMVKQFIHDVIVITSKASIKNFKDDIKKIGMNREIIFYTYKKFIKEYQLNINLALNKILIIDEAHHLRNETRDVLLIISASQSAYRLILLTATPILNYINDLSVLINMIKKEDILPTNKKLFDFYYYNEDNDTINNQIMLENKIKNTISYYENTDTENYCKKKEYVIKVEMSPAQMLEYKKFVSIIILDKKVVNPDTDVRLDDLYINYGLLDKKKKNSFLSATRQLSNVIDNNTITPKLQKIFNKLISNKFPAIIYSNYLDAGVFPLSKMLDKANIKHSIISGVINEVKLDNIVNKYNNGEIQVLLLTTAGSESLDLKNTRQIHIVEPHWNDAKIRQVIGRAIRYKSHDLLPLKERVVKIYRWISIFPFKVNFQTADEYLDDLSKKKDKLFEKFKELIIKNCIEKN